MRDEAPEPISPDAVRPVRNIPGDRERAPEDGLAVCLSGGGYRAMVFHVGFLWRLNELGLLPRIARFSSVSGGSITAGVLAMNWSNLQFDERGIASNFGAEIVAPVRRMAGVDVDVKAVVTGALLPGHSIADRVTAAYRRHLFGATTLQDLPDDPPRFMFNATNLETGVLMRFCKPYLGDYKIGRVLNPTLPLADVVAASSAFPPVLSPYRLRLNGATWRSDEGNDPKLTNTGYRSEIDLSDGGVYDNLGLETAWKKYRSILVSDAGGILEADPDPDDDWVRHTVRVLNVVDRQVRALRKRQVVGSLKAKLRQGMYVGIWSDVRDFKRAVLPADLELTKELAGIATRLQSLGAEKQELLVNWGYAVCDAGLRSYYLADQLADAPPTPLPYPARPLTKSTQEAVP